MPPRHRPCVCQSHLQSIIAGWCKEKLIEISGSQRRELFSKFNRWLAGEAPWSKTELVQLVLDSLNQTGVLVSDVVDIIAVKIHVGIPTVILQIDAMDLPDRGQAGSGNGLVQKDASVPVQKPPAFRRKILILPLGSQGAGIDIPFPESRDHLTTITCHHIRSSRSGINLR